MIAGSPASIAGLQPADIIISIDDVVITGLDDIARTLDDRRIGKSVHVRYLRNARLDRLDLIPDERI